MSILSDINEYENEKSMLKISCNLCNFIWNTNLDRIKKASLCPKCSIKRRTIGTRYSVDEIKEVCIKNNCILLDINGYERYEDKIFIECLVCKHGFYKPFINLRRKGLHCPNCYKLKKKLANGLRNRLKNALHGNYKSGSAVRDLGCSIEELKQRLEKQFYTNSETGEMMTWDNYGYRGWHVDHIIPLASFDLTKREQLLKACHYTNLQPLWAKENLSKGAKIK